MMQFYLIVSTVKPQPHRQRRRRGQGRRGDRRDDHSRARGSACTKRRRSLVWPLKPSPT